MADSLLIVDDERGFLEFLVYLLKPMGFEIQTAADGLEAVQWVERRTFDAVIMDTIMPNLNGLEALVRIRELRPELPVIMLASGLQGPSEGFTKEALAKRGAAAYLLKPVELKDLLAALEKVLGKPLAVSGTEGKDGKPREEL